MKDDTFTFWFPILIICVIILCLVINSWKETSSSSTIDYQKTMYAQVKVDGGRLYKVQLFCPNKTYTYLTTDSYVIDSRGRADFTDYSTSFEIKSSCPAICLPVVRKTEDFKLTKEQMEKMYLLNDQNISVIGEDKSLETTSKLPQSIIINNNNNNNVQK